MKGVLLINLGSPEDLEISSIKKYLKEFLSDEYVLDLPKIIRQFLVNFIIVPFRSPKTKEAYESIWTENGSPLILNTKLISKKLEKKIKKPVETSMRYQKPSIEAGLKNLINKGCDEIIAVPLYPHYAQSTSLTTELEVKRLINKINPEISLTISPPFYNNSNYINSLSDSINKHLPKDFDYLLFSYHGIPERHVRKMDPTTSHCLKNIDCCEQESESHKFCYRHQVKETSKLCAEKLNLDDDKWGISFQSRIGPGWLQPFTDKVLEDLPNKNINKIAVVCPAFIADNLETLEEMNIRGKESFIDSGGQDFTFIPCINDNDLFIDFLEEFVSE